MELRRQGTGATGVVILPVNKLAKCELNSCGNSFAFYFVLWRDLVVQLELNYSLGKV